MRKYALIVIAVVVVFAGVYVYMQANSQSIERTTQETNSSETAEATQKEGEANNTIRLLATGDMIPHDTVNLRAGELDGLPYTAFFNTVQPAFNNADIVFCNQEAPSAGESFGISGYPTFNAPKSFAQGLSSIGCNLINLANNHVADKGTDAIAETLKVWDNLSPYAVAGANTSATEQNSIRTFELNGKTFAFLAFAEFSNNTSVPNYSVNIFNEQLVNSLMAKAREQADFIIVSAHWGIESQETTSQFQNTWAKRLADNGADLIIGTGPHLIQTVDELPKRGGGKTLVYYSLGNALSTQLQTEELFGVFAVIDLAVEENMVTISRQRVLPVYMHYEWTEQQANAEDLLKRNNLGLHPLEGSQSLIEKSLLDTSESQQRERIRKLVNQNINTPLVSLNAIDD